jgi:IS30 family transposase
MSYTHLTPEQRYQIEAFLQAGTAVVQIAQKVGVHKSTIYNELNRSGCAKGGYVAAKAQEAAEQRARRTAANHPM